MSTTSIQPSLFERHSNLPEIEPSELLSALRRNVSLLNELAIRYEVETRPERDPERPAITTGQAVYNLLAPEMAHLAQEQVRVLLLDRQNRLVGQRTIYQGNAYSAVVRAAEIFKPAVVESAPSIIAAHNHPSGEPTPSRPDIDLTRDLAEAGKLLGVSLVDHIVIGSDGWRSLREDGHID